MKQLSRSLLTVNTAITFLLEFQMVEVQATRILLVEDDPNDVELIRIAFEKL